MSTAITLRSNIADDINAAHAAADQALRGAVKACIRAGDLLIEAKRLHGKHGQWSKWLAENITFSDRLARAYMQLARLPEAKRQRVADLPLRDALSAIRSREQRIADTEEREARVFGPAQICTVVDGKVVFGEEAVLAINATPAPPPLPPRSSEEIADEIIGQLAQTLYEARGDIDVDYLRTAFERRFPSDPELEGAEEIEGGPRAAFLLRADQAIDLAKNAATLIGKFDATKNDADFAQRAASAWGKIAYELKCRVPDARP